jgi:DNA-directed RNA polymerase subunit RPC12/RpoP
MGAMKGIYTKAVRIAIKIHIECSDCGYEEVLDDIPIDFHCNDEYRCERCTSTNKPFLQGIYEHIEEE